VGTALCAALAVPLLAVLGPPARAAPTSPPAQAQHVVIVGISGLTWNIVTQAPTGELWRLAAAGSVGSLVDYAQEPLACPVDGWLTLNSAARAQGPRPCMPLPAVTRVGVGARVQAMPQIIADNRQFHESPDWGLLGTLASCATAVGPGAALALTTPAGTVSSYVPSPGDLSRSVLARCPLTVVDLGQIAASERERISAVDRQLAQIAAELPAGTLLLVTAPGAAVAGQNQAKAGPPHLMSVLVSGPGFAGGLLDSSATRRPGIVALTDLTPTVAAWLGHPVPAGTVGARIGRTDRSSLDSTVTGLTARDNAEQVWISTHGWFFVGYAVGDALAFGIPALLLWGSGQERRGRRAQCWRIAGAVAAAVPLASYLANLAPWWYWAHPAWWLYGMTIAWTPVIAGAALAGPWRRDVLGPFGAICAATLLLLAVDVIAGSRLQLDAPFGLSLLVSGRFYGIGNDALGVYCVAALVAAAWLASAVAPRASTELSLGPPATVRGGPEADADLAPQVPRNMSSGPGSSGAGADLALEAIRPIRENLSVVAVGVVGLLAVVASGWPGFGAKAGGTIALVPCLLLLAAWLAGVRISGRWAVPVAVSGLVVFLAFAVASYFLPGTGVSDIGTFAGNLLHGRGGELLERKVSSNVGSLTLNVFSWLIPVAAALAGAALWRPAALRLRTLAAAFAALPLLRVLAWLIWLVLVIGWFADDSGVIVPAAALPFVVPLTIAMAASVIPKGPQFPQRLMGQDSLLVPSPGHPSQADPPR
jgi:hypothetical protein